MAHSLQNDIYKNIFLHENFFNSRWNLIQLCSFEFNWKYISIGSDSGLVPNWQQAVIWTNEELVLWHIYQSLNKAIPQNWGIWKLRPAYSPETPNLGQNRWCFVPCDLEIWWMTLNKANLRDLKAATGL